MSETITVNKDKYIEYKAKAELYDKEIASYQNSFGARNGGILNNLTNYLAALEKAKEGKISLYITRSGELVILPLKRYSDLFDFQRIINEKQIDIKDITETTDDYMLYVAYCKGKDYDDDYICTYEEFKLLRRMTNCD